MLHCLPHRPHSPCSLYTVVPYLVRFIDSLTNIYVRYNRKRLKVSSSCLLAVHFGRMWLAVMRCSKALRNTKRSHAVCPYPPHNLLPCLLTHSALQGRNGPKDTAWHNRFCSNLNTVCPDIPSPAGPQRPRGHGHGAGCPV